MERHDEIRILSTDMDMPGSMDDPALAVRVRSRWPSVRIIIASGAMNAPQADMPKGALFFPKPHPILQIPVG